MGMIIEKVMSPRIVLGAPPDADLGGGIIGPPLPRSLDGQPIWNEVYLTEFGWEFRLAVDFVTVIQPVAPAQNQYVYVAWVPSDARVGPNTVFAQLAPALEQIGTLSAWWKCDERDGMIVPHFDDSPEADLVQQVWPADWAERLETDNPEQPPSGPHIVGLVLA